MTAPTLYALWGGSPPSLVHSEEVGEEMLTLWVWTSREEAEAEVERYRLHFPDTACEVVEYAPRRTA